MLTIHVCCTLTCDRCNRPVPADSDWLTDFEDRDTIHFATAEEAYAALGTILAGIRLADDALPGWPAGTVLDRECLAKELCAHGHDFPAWDNPASDRPILMRACNRPYCLAYEERDGTLAEMELAVQA